MTDSPLRHFLFLILTLTGLLHGQQEVRVWTDERGRTVEASLISISSETIQLQLQEGRSVSWPVSRLSLKDQAFVETQRSAFAGKPTQTWHLPWPIQAGSSQVPRIQVLPSSRAKQSKQHFDYRSAHFHFRSDAELSTEAVARLAQLFESTRDYLKQLPLGLSHNQADDKPWSIQLFEDPKDYVDAGGDERFSGYFLRKDGISKILVPIKSLGLSKEFGRYVPSASGNNQVLAHEITHLMTPLCYFAPQGHAWFTDGLAEFVATTPYHNGIYRKSQHLNHIADYVSAAGHKGKGGRHLGTQIKLPPLREFLTMNYQRFSGDRANLNYGSALLITAYFCYLDDQTKPTRLQGYLRELQDPSAPKNFNSLLNGLSWEKLESKISKAWKARGIELTFQQN